MPGLTGGGATRVNLEVATPIVVIPVALTVATIGKISTCIVLSVLPYFCFFFYRIWKRRSQKSRTKFFYVWGVMSVIYMYIIFELILCRHATVSNTDNFVITISVIFMFLALYHARKDPGIVHNGSNFNAEDLHIGTHDHYNPIDSNHSNNKLVSGQSWESGSNDATLVQLYSQGMSY